MIMALGAEVCTAGLALIGNAGVSRGSGRRRRVLAQVPEAM